MTGHRPAFRQRIGERNDQGFFELTVYARHPLAQRLFQESRVPEQMTWEVRKELEVDVKRALFREFDFRRHR